jgi:hypothetical protein
LWKYANTHAQGDTLGGWHIWSRVVKFGKSRSSLELTRRRTGRWSCASGEWWLSVATLDEWPSAGRSCDLTHRGVSPVMLTYADVRALVTNLAARKWSDSVSRPVRDDLTCPVAKKHLRELTVSDQMTHWWCIQSGYRCVRSLACWLGCACDRTLRGCVRSSLPSVRSSLDCEHREFDRWRSMVSVWSGDTWTRIVDRTLGCYTSGHFERRVRSPRNQCSEEPNNSIRGALYLSPLVGSSSLSWSFALT